MCLLYETYKPQTVKIGNTIYTKAYNFVGVEHFEYNLDNLKSEIQDKIDEGGWDVTITSLKKIRATQYDYIIGEAWYPAESPIAPIIVAAICAVIVWALKVAAIAIAAYIVVRVLEMFTPKALHCSYCGAEVPDATSLKAHIATAHPDKPQEVCPYCGLQYMTQDELAKHIKECPLRPWTEKIPWDYVAIGVTVIIPTAYVIGQVLKRRE